MKQVKDITKVRWNKKYLVIDTQYNDFYIYYYEPMIKKGYRIAIYPPEYKINLYNKRSYVYKHNYSEELLNISRYPKINMYEFEDVEDYKKILLGLELLK